jgi:pSer/pThr/pTyr-binding forkhead associated (FHA) protein
MKIKLIWTDIQTGQVRETIQQTPIALGRGFSQMPSVIEGKSVVRIVFVDPAVSIFHALLDEENGELIIIDQKSTNGTFVNGLQQDKCQVLEQDTIQIGRYQIQVEILDAPLTKAQTSNSSSQSLRSSENHGNNEIKELHFSQANSLSEYSNQFFNSYSNLDNPNTEPGFSQSDYFSEYSRDESFDYQQNIDFTEADSQSLAVEADTNFEQDMGAS